MVKQPIYEVTYIKHSVVSETEVLTENLTEKKLREHLNNGMISLIKAERIFEQR